MTSPTIVWLRDDLRIADNPALVAAANRGGPVVIVYLLEDAQDGLRALGGASRWWLHGSLIALAESLGGNLVLRRGRAADVLPALVAETGADAVYWNRRYGAARDIDAALKSRFKDEGLDCQSFQANLMFEPWTVRTGQGTPFQVFTPFWNACLARGGVRAPLDVPSFEHGLVEVTDVASDNIDDWNLLPTHPDWAGGLREHCEPGEDAAHERLENFVEYVLENYHRRDEPGIETTSGLSPYLRFGEISPFQIWARVHEPMERAAERNRDKFLSEVGWREFNYSILFENTALATTNFRSEFDAFEWSTPTSRTLEAWQQGRTGIPLVDAGMRELWESGTMHNRVRMVCASFLIKNLLVDWRIGEQWFWDCLVDADPASNPGNWQWVAGSGADAAPYFRVFNPVLQQEKFDRDLSYVRRWVPEYGTDDYPQPIIDLATSREEALAHYEVVKAQRDVASTAN